MKVSYLPDVVDDELMRDNPRPPEVMTKSPRKVVIGRRKKPSTIHRGCVSVLSSSASQVSGLSGSCVGSITNSLSKVQGVVGGTATPNRGPGRFVAVNLDGNLGAADVAKQTELVMNNLKNLKNNAGRSLSQHTTESDKENIDTRNNRVQSNSPARRTKRLPLSPLKNPMLHELQQEFSPSPVKHVAALREHFNDTVATEPVEAVEVRKVSARNIHTSTATKAYVSMKRLDLSQLPAKDAVNNIIEEDDDDDDVFVDQVPRPSDAFQPTPARFGSRSKSRKVLSSKEGEGSIDDEMTGEVDMNEPVEKGRTFKHPFKPGMSRPSEADLGFAPPRVPSPKVPSEVSEITFRFREPSTSKKSASLKRKEAPEDISHLQGECRYFQSWIPRLRNKRLYVEGDLIDLDKSSLGVGQDQRWVTSKIVTRVSRERVATKGGTIYVLEGPLVVRNVESGKMVEDGPTPNFVIDKFREGFPENWERIVNHWIKFNEQNTINSSNMSAIFNSTSATNMAMSNLTALSNISAISSNTSRFLNPGNRMINTNLTMHMGANLSILPEEQLDETRPQFEVINFTTRSRSRKKDDIGKASGKRGSRSRSPLKSVEEVDEETEVSEVPASARRSRSKTVRYNKNSTRTEKAERTHHDNAMEVTMSQHDFSMLRAKNYENTTFVNKKKNYNCHFCDFRTHLFNNLKLHIKKNHLAEGGASSQSPSQQSPRAQSNESVLAGATPAKQKPRRSSFSPSKVATQIINSETCPKPSLEEQVAKCMISKNSFHCTDCNFKCKNRAGIVSHLKSKKHADKLRSKSKAGNIPQDLDRSKSKGSKDRSKGSKDSPKASKSRSKSSNRPTLTQKKGVPKPDQVGKELPIKSKPLVVSAPDPPVSASPPIVKIRRKSHAPGLKTYVCFACDESYEQDQEMFNHLMTSKHSKMVKTCKENKFLSCNACMTNTDRKDDYIKHMRTKKHLTAMAKKKSLIECPEVSDQVLANEGSNKKTSRFGRAKKKSLIECPEVSDQVLVNEGSNKKTSRFGRSIKKTKALTRESCVYGTPEEIEPEEVVKRSRPVKNSKKVNNPTKALVESPRRTVLNPFKKRSEEIVQIRKPVKSTEDILGKVSVNPKTVKQRQQNAEALKEYNEDHEDDIFDAPVPSVSKPSLLKPSTKTLLTEDSDSDSEQDISLHSARTPMTSYFGKNALRSTTPMMNQDKTPGILFQNSPLVSMDTEGFQAQAYIHKKVAEKAKDARKVRKHKLASTLMSKVVSRTQADKLVDESSQVINTITNHTASLSQIGEDDDEEDDWFEDVQEKNLSCDPGAGLLELLAKQPV